MTYGPTSEWKDLKGKIKSKFGKLSDSELDSLQGHMDQLQSKVQKVYGYDKEKAERECKRFNDSVKKKAI
jgi:uncharacterized protein YjbJ (UPF0337 family)